MKLLCAIFGHQKMPPGWYGDIQYGKIVPGKVDGIGRRHGVVTHECWRCGKDYVVSRIHLPAALEPSP